MVIAIGLNQAQTDPNDLAAAVLDRVLVSMGRRNAALSLLQTYAKLSHFCVHVDAMLTEPGV